MILPEHPLQLLEMDIKMTWLESIKKHAYTLTLIDTFTRVCLHRITQLSIKKQDVKAFWDYVIITHLQPKDCLNKKIEIEVRNDNDKRFSAKMIQDYFKENHLNQVFTRPYTPQENGHIESFHAILSRHLKPYLFWSLEELEQYLELFYHKYNTYRIHHSTAYLSPQDFWTLWNKGLIERKVNLKKRKMKFTLKIPYHQVAEHSGNNEPESSSLPLCLSNPEIKKEMDDAESSHNSRSKKSPSVVPC